MYWAPYERATFKRASMQGLGVDYSCKWQVRYIWWAREGWSLGYSKIDNRMLKVANIRSSTYSMQQYIAIFCAVPTITSYRSAWGGLISCSNLTWWHSANSSGFINVDCFLRRIFHLPITLQKTICTVTTEILGYTSAHAITQHFFGAQVGYQFYVYS